MKLNLAKEQEQKKEKEKRKKKREKKRKERKKKVGAVRSNGIRRRSYRARYGSREYSKYSNRPLGTEYGVPRHVPLYSSGQCS